MTKPLYRRVVPATYTQLLYEYLESLGHEPDALLQQPRYAADPNGLDGVDVKVWETMLARASQALNEPLIGICVGKRVSARHLGLMGAVLLACDSLGSALDRFHHYQRLIFDVLPMRVEHDSNHTLLRWDLDDQAPGHLVEQAGLAVLVQFARSMVDADFSPSEVRFSGSGPTQIELMQDFFDCPVLFNHPQPGLQFETRLLTLPVKGKDPLLVNLLVQHANQLLDQLPREQEITEKVRREIAKALQHGEPTAERICKALNTSHRTLLRKLAIAGTNFRSELNLVRKELASSYLQDPRLRITDIAMLLGYSDHSAFTRAYKEWMGAAPKTLR